MPARMTQPQKDHLVSIYKDAWPLLVERWLEPCAEDSKRVLRTLAKLGYTEYKGKLFRLTEKGLQKGKQLI